MPVASDTAACVPMVSVASNSGCSGLGVAVELDGPEVDPEGNALPTGAAGATLVALALSRAEGIVAGGEGSGVFNKGRPLSGCGLEEGPQGAAFPNRDHEGGHFLFLTGLDQDPANEAERRVNP